MARPRFSWEVFEETHSLILKVTDGDRETVWRIGPRPNAMKVADVFLEIVEDLGNYQVPVKQSAPQRAPEKPQQSPEVVEDTQMSEEGSAELRAAKARMVEKTGRTWFSNMEVDEELPLYTIGHEE